MDKLCRQRDRVNGGDDASATRPSGGGGGSDAPNFSFAPRDVVRAVTFHLLDERIATRVCPRSVERLLRRTSAAAAPVRISASLWRGMRNRQRLEWLLANSGTHYRVRASDRVAELLAAGG